MRIRAQGFPSLFFWTAAFLGFAGATGCGGDEPGHTGPGASSLGSPRSGSRLEVRGTFLNESLGSDLRLYDKELELSCFVSRVAGGEGDYCVPSRFFEMFFTDEACSDESAVAYLRNTNCLSWEEGDLAYSIIGGADCNDRIRLHRLGETIDAPSQLYWRSFADGSCDTVPAEEGGTFRALEPASPDQLVSFTERIDDIEGSELQVRGNAGDDGSFLPTELHANGESCHAAGTTEGRFCLPRSLPGSGSGFSDESCTTFGPLTQISSSSCSEQPEYVQMPGEGQCPVIERILRVSGSPVPAYGGDLCEEHPTPYVTFTEVEEVPLSSFTPVESLWVGEGAIEARVHASNGVPLGTALEYRIRETGAHCYPSEFSDGTQRCVPATNYGYQGSSHYSDAACEEELYGGYPFGPCGEDPDLDGLVYLESDSAVCASKVERAIRLVPYEGPLYVVDSSSGECTETPESLTSDTLFVAGDEIPLDELPEFSRNSLP